MIRPLARLLAAAVLALGVSGCGSDDDGGSADAPPSGASSSPSASTSASPSTSPSASSSDAGTDSTATSQAPSGGGQSVSAAGLSFEVPTGYLAVDAATVAAGGGVDDALQELADRLGVTLEQLKQEFNNIDLLAVDQAAQAGEFADNVNLISTEGGAIPTEDQAREQFEQAGFAVRAVDPVSTGAGDGVTISYSGTVSGFDVNGRSVFIQVGDAVANVTISSGDPGTADTVTELVTTTMTAD